MNTPSLSETPTQELLDETHRMEESTQELLEELDWLSDVCNGSATPDETHRVQDIEYELWKRGEL